MNPFSRRALLVLFGVGLVTFGLGLLLAAFSPDVFEQRSATNDVFSRSLVGHRALVELLRRSGLVVVISRSATQSRATAAFPLLLLEPEPARERSIEDLLLDDGQGRLSELSREQRLRRLVSAARDQGAQVVVALPKWRAVPSERFPGWIEAQQLVPARQVERFLDDLVRAATRPEEDVELQGSDQPQLALRLSRVAEIRHPRAAELGIDSPQLDLGDQIQLLAPDPMFEPLIACEQGVLVGRLTGGLTVVSDPDLFNNRGLGRVEHAELVMALLRDRLGAQGVVVDETQHGFTTGESLMARAMRFPLVVIVIHALLAMALAAWSLAAGFGRPLPPPPELPPGKQLLMDNTARLLLAGGDHSEALRRYLRVSLTRMARRFGLAAAERSDRHPDEPELALVPRLQAISDARGLRVDLSALVQASQNRALRSAEALRLARRLHAWRMSLQGVELRRAAPSRH